MSNSNSGEFEYGAPWSSQLTISSLSENVLQATNTPLPKKWFWLTAAISCILTVLCFLGVWAGASTKSVNAAMVISCAILGFLCFLVCIFAVGYSSYSERLTINKSEVRYSRRFFWIQKEVMATKSTIQCVKGWQYGMGGQRGVKMRSCHLCIHFSQAIPPLSLKSVDYTPSHTQQAAALMGMRSSQLIVSYEEAARIIQQLGVQISEKLNIPFNT